MVWGIVQDVFLPPMNDRFTDKPDFTPYTALPNQVPLDEMNPKTAALQGKQKHWAKESMKIPLADVDMGDAKVFSRVLWYSVKGFSTRYPNN